MNATLWQFSGLFFSGSCDKAGTPIGDICSGWFATAGDDQAVAEQLLASRYADQAGRWSVRQLNPAPATPWAAKTLACAMKRGSTKQVPVLV